MSSPLKFGLIATLIIGVNSAAIGQTMAASSRAQTQSRPSYLIDRSAEDWSFLRDVSKRSDPWDPLKYILFGRSDDRYLTIGGEFRPFYERYQSDFWGAGPQDDSGFYLQRLMLHADIHANARSRIFVEVKSGVEVDRNGGPRPADEDKMDLNEAFLDLYHGERSGSQAAFTLRIGRQEVNYGDGGTLAIREGLNVRRAFDGVKIIFRIADWRLDAFALKPDKTNVGYFDDSPDHAQTLVGFYGSSRPRFAGFLGQIEPFYIYLDRKQARFDQGATRDQRHTAGIHTINQAGRWIYEFAGYLQFGKFGAGNILAWKNIETVSYAIQNTRFRPLVGLNFAISSGDRDSKSPDLQTFHPLFPKGLYYGYIDSIGSLNSIVVHPHLNLRIVGPVSLTAEAFTFWRQSIHDGVYSQPGVFLRTGQFSRAHYLGSLYETELGWTVNAHTTAALQVAHFASGAFFHDTPPGENINYVSVKATFKF